MSFDLPHVHNPPPNHNNCWIRCKRAINRFTKRHAIPFQFNDPSALQAYRKMSRPTRNPQQSKHVLCLQTSALVFVVMSALALVSWLVLRSPALPPHASMQDAMLDSTSQQQQKNAQAVDDLPAGIDLNDISYGADKNAAMEQKSRMQKPPDAPVVRRTKPELPVEEYIIKPKPVVKSDDSAKSREATLPDKTETNTKSKSSESDKHSSASSATTTTASAAADEKAAAWSKYWIEDTPNKDYEKGAVFFEPSPQKPIAPFINPLLKVSTSNLPAIKTAASQMDSSEKWSYSHFRFLGDRGRVGAHADRTCHFKNVCFAHKSKEWRYYRRPAEKQWPILNDNGVIVTEFDSADKFVNLKSTTGVDASGSWWRPKIVNTMIPKGAKSFASTDERALHLLFTPSNAQSLAKTLGNDANQAWNQMASFNLLSSQVQLISTHSCDEMYDSVEKRKVCESMLSRVMSGVSKQPLLWQSKLNAKDSSEDLSCFSNLLVGSSIFGYQQSLGKGWHWQAFHNYYLSNLGLSPQYTPHEQRITLIEPDPVSMNAGEQRDLLANRDELLAAIKFQFGSQASVVSTSLSALGSTWPAQLKALQQTTVLIASCGDLSFPGLMLPHGAAIILVDWYISSKQQSQGCEDRLWTSVSYLRAMHYPYKADELALPDGITLDNGQGVKMQGKVKVKPEKMARLVKAALAHTSNFMTMDRP